MDEKTLRLVECCEQILDRLEHHGGIDPIREEGPIEDLRDAIQEMQSD